MPISAYQAFVLKYASRALKSSDKWALVVGEKNKCLEVKNRFTQELVSVPLKAVIFGFRRLSRIDITNELDYLIVNNFNFAPKIFGVLSDKLSQCIKIWKQYATSRMTILIFSRRFDLSAPGTRLLAHFSNFEFIPTKLFWVIKGVPITHAKILSIWFNSSLHLLQVFLERMETRGAFINFDKYVLENSLVLNLSKLNEDELNCLKDLFEEARKEKFPSLLDQLHKKSQIRMKIDKAILKILEFSENEIDDILDFLYSALTNKIEQLKALMKS